LDSAQVANIITHNLRWGWFFGYFILQ
jgi:hypothetical protein